MQIRLDILSSHPRRRSSVASAWVWLGRWPTRGTRAAVQVKSGRLTSLTGGLSFNAKTLEVAVLSMWLASFTIAIADKHEEIQSFHSFVHSRSSISH